jgi:hypothetical protein
MRRVMLLALSVLMVVSMAVPPAFAHDRDGDCWDEDGKFWSCDRNRHDRDRNDNDDVCVAVVFVPIGFWNFDFWNWFWFWQDLGSHWECSD